MNQSITKHLPRCFRVFAQYFENAIFKAEFDLHVQRRVEHATQRKRSDPLRCGPRVARVNFWFALLRGQPG